MKKEQKPFSELYSPEMKLKIDEVHSMIMEQAGHLNLSSLIPNWKNMKMDDLGNSIISVSSKLNKIVSPPIKEDSTDWSKTRWSPRWRKSKFGKMYPSEVAEYVQSSPERRKEVRDLLEKEYDWLIKNAPSNFSNRMYRKTIQQRMKSGVDPFDWFYEQGETNKSPVLAYIAVLTLFLQLLVWILF